MADFKAITTQEEFDEAIKSRLDRQEKTIAARYSDYDALKTAAAKHDEDLLAWNKKAQEDAETIKKLTADLQTANETIKAHETKALKASIAAEVGLPAGLTDRLTGATADEIRKDAQSLKTIFDQKNREGLPGFSGNEKKPTDDPKDEAFKDLLAKMNGTA